MIKKLALAILLFLCMPLYGQIENPPLILTSDPTGACANGKLAMNILTNSLFYCAGSVWNTGSGTGGTVTSFITGTSGTDFNINLVGTTATFNIPDATATARGLVTTGAQVFAGNKTFTGDLIANSITLTSPDTSWNFGEMDCSTVTPQTATDTLCADSNAHQFLVSNNGGALVPLVNNTTTVVTNTVGSGLLIGGKVIWDGNLDFTIQAATYLIGGNSYSSAETNITLTAADVSNPRIDALVLTTSGTAIKVDGTAASSPALPSVDPQTELLLKFILVNTSATTPTGFVNTYLYLENTEWTCTASANFNCASTTNPFAGTKDIEATNVVATNNITLVKPTSGTENLSNYENYVFHIRNKGVWPNPKSVILYWLNGSLQVGNSVTLKDGQFSFTTSNTTGYQTIAIPTSLFNTGTTLVTTLEAQVTGGGGAIPGFYLDNIGLQGGSNTVALTTAQTTRTCMIDLGADNAASALTNADLGPQKRSCFIPYAATLREITVSADDGTPNVILQSRIGASTVADLLSGALATGASGVPACALLVKSGVCTDGTASSATVVLTNTNLLAGTYIELKSGTAGATAKSMQIAVTFTVNQ